LPRNKTQRPEVWVQSRKSPTLLTVVAALNG